MLSRPFWFAIALDLGRTFHGLLTLVVGLLGVSATGLLLVGAWWSAVLLCGLAGLVYESGIWLARRVR